MKEWSSRKKWFLTCTGIQCLWHFLKRIWIKRIRRMRENLSNWFQASLLNASRNMCIQYVFVVVFDDTVKALSSYISWFTLYRFFLVLIHFILFYFFFPLFFSLSLFYIVQENSDIAYIYRMLNIDIIWEAIVIKEWIIIIDTLYIHRILLTYSKWFIDKTEWILKGNEGVKEHVWP